jgi:acyl-CoA reductase-like NAD-dependent aldehyde dehydrogenase
MLALTDSQLRSVMDAAEKLQPTERAAFLEQLADRAERNRRAAAQRVALHRVRRAAGVTVACIHVSGAVLELLAASPLLS